MSNVVTKIKAISMLSGGLDSAIATKLVMEQGIECIAINFSSPFCTCDSGGKCNSKEIAKNLGIEYKVVAKGEEFLEIVRNPKHGYGQGLNPCIDCKIFILSKARAMMDELGASFVITGEVLGQRPMSQHKRALEIIEKESRLEGKILRPLSANLFSETDAEKNGWIDRKKLLSVQGRGRTEQLRLARNFSITTYACAGGGCLLTEKKFAIKLKDLFDHKDKIIYRDISLIKIGRHFRFGDNKIIVGRNEKENKMLAALKSEDDLLFEVPNGASPTTLMQGSPYNDAIKFAAQLTALYSDCKDNEVFVDYIQGNSQKIAIKIIQIKHEEANKYNLAFKKLGQKKLIVDIIK